MIQRTDKTTGNLQFTTILVTIRLQELILGDNDCANNSVSRVISVKENNIRRQRRVQNFIHKEWGEKVTEFYFI